MDEVERLAADIAEDHRGMYVTVTLGDLTLGDFWRLRECVAILDPTITLLRRRQCEAEMKESPRECGTC
jgi:hypothetical protein